MDLCSNKINLCTENTLSLYKRTNNFQLQTQHWAIGGREKGAGCYKK